MGNQSSSHRYYSSNEALTIINDKEWGKLRKQLNRAAAGKAKNGSLDYSIFVKVLQAHFDYMPRILAESLYLGFANELSNPIKFDDFIATLAIMNSDRRDRSLVIKFLFRVYEVSVHGNAVMDRHHCEKLMKAAYGSSSCSSSSLPSLMSLIGLVDNGEPTDDVIARQLDSIFQTPQSSSQHISLRDLETNYVGPIDVLGGWVQHVLNVFTEPLPHRLAMLDKKYTATLDNDQMMTKFPHLTDFICDQLRHLFFGKCEHVKRMARSSIAVESNKYSSAHNSYSNVRKLELTMDDWIDWLKEYLHPSLNKAIFLMNTASLKRTWRLTEFLDFCMVFGRGDLEDQVNYLLQACCKNYVRFNRSRPSATGQGQALPISSLVTASSNAEDSAGQSVDEGAEEEEEETDKRSSSSGRLTGLKAEMRRMIYLLALSVSDSTSIADSDDDLVSLEISSIFIPMGLRNALETLELERNPPLKSYMEALMEYHEHFPGLRELGMSACCLFGIRPRDPAKEKEYIMELMLRRQARAPQTRTQPFGPVGTEWCVIVKSWWDTWRFFVGHKRVVATSNNPNGHNHSTSSTSNNDSPLLPSSHNSQGGGPKEPGEIDNSTILKRSGPRQLLPGLTQGQDIEFIPPEVYYCCRMWYGGGPKISRKVIASGLLELFPLSIRIFQCDANGKTVTDSERHGLYSRVALVAEVREDIFRTLQQDYNSSNSNSSGGHNFRNDFLHADRFRIWNIQHADFKKHFVMSPESTLEKCKLEEGSSVLVEISLEDGSWPRARLHARLIVDEDEKEKSVLLSNNNSSHHNNNNNNNMTSSSSSATSSSSSNLESLGKWNSGRVGLENLGNTCYMNSSIEALIHTEPLKEYFLTKSHLQDVNHVNKFGYGGKLANSFGRLVNDLWTTHKKNLSPSNFVHDLSSIFSQFSGNQQHDAQEILAIILDGLSEDLNLVDEKPYTEQPDSDGRPDQILADIWWENHLKRDMSVIQALFTGQFKSVMTCSCGYSSARFEPFNILALPIPETTLHSISIHVVPLPLPLPEASVSASPVHAIRVTVRVDKKGDFNSLIDACKRLSPPVFADHSFFITAEIVKSKVHRVLPLGSKLAGYLSGSHASENIFIYESSRPHFGMIHGSKTIQLPLFSESAAQAGSGHQFQGPDNEVYNRAVFGDFNLTWVPEEAKYYQERQSNHDTKITAPEEDANEAVDVNAEEGEKEVLNEQIHVHITDIPVRVSFVQRRAKLRSDSSVCIDAFVMEVFGVPLMEAVPRVCSGKYLYDAINSKVSTFLKRPVSQIMEFYNTNLQRRGSSSQPVEDGAAGTVIRDSIGNSAVVHWAKQGQQIETQGQGIYEGAAPRQLRPISTDELLGGSISRTGFALRLVTGGENHCIGCVRCKWMARCQGCFIPDSDASEINLRDGETIAVDWHVAVFEELLSLELAAKVIDHEASANKNSKQENAIPLEKCLDKFTEEEPLEGVVCPKCKADDKLKKAFALWRLPPILVVQLKRFQFDNVSRRKLVDVVDFPINGLDVSNYVVSTAVEAPLSLSSAVDKECSDDKKNDNNDNNIDIDQNIDVQGDPITEGEHEDIDDCEVVEAEERPSSSSSGSSNSIASASVTISASISASASLSASAHSCARYDLYSTVHHMGALSGGHYVTSAKVKEPHAASATASATTTPEGDGQAPEAEIPAGSWCLFNDDIVSELKGVRDIQSSSAYLLFYIRQDIKNVSVNEILKPYRDKASSRGRDRNKNMSDAEMSIESSTHGNGSACNKGATNSQSTASGKIKKSKSKSKIRSKGGQQVKSIAGSAKAGIHVAAEGLEHGAASINKFVKKLSTSAAPWTHKSNNQRQSTSSNNVSESAGQMLRRYDPVQATGMEVDPVTRHLSTSHSSGSSDVFDQQSQAAALDHDDTSARISAAVKVTERRRIGRSTIQQNAFSSREFSANTSTDTMGNSSTSSSFPGTSTTTKSSSPKSNNIGGSCLQS